jgi:hypothetical protein
MKILISFVLLILFSTEGLAQTSDSIKIKVSLENLSFISGHWQSKMGDGISDEQWSLPLGDSMMGMFRYVKEGKAVFYEFMLIEMSAEGPALKLKHFNPGLIGWEEKAQVWSYPLVEFQKDKAVFERPDKGMRMTFQRLSVNALTVWLERPDKAGKWKKDEYKYELVL